MVPKADRRAVTNCLDRWDLFELGSQRWLHEKGGAANVVERTHRQCLVCLSRGLDSLAVLRGIFLVGFASGHLWSFELSAFHSSTLDSVRLLQNGSCQSPTPPRTSIKSPAWGVGCFLEGEERVCFGECASMSHKMFFCDGWMGEGESRAVFLFEGCCFLVVASVVEGVCLGE